MHFLLFRGVRTRPWTRALDPHLLFRMTVLQERLEQIEQEMMKKHGIEDSQLDCDGDLEDYADSFFVDLLDEVQEEEEVESSQ